MWTLLPEIQPFSTWKAPALSVNEKSIAADTPQLQESPSPRIGHTPLISVPYVGKSGAVQSTSTTSRTPPYRRTPGWWKLVDALSMVMGHS